MFKQFKSPKQFSSGINYPTRPGIPQTEQELEQIKQATATSTQQVRWFKVALQQWAKQLANGLKMHKLSRAADKLEIGIGVLAGKADSSVKVAEKKGELAGQLIEHSETTQISAYEHRLTQRKQLVTNRWNDFKQKQIGGTK